MGLVDRIRALCQTNGITLNQLEKGVGRVERRSGSNPDFSAKSPESLIFQGFRGFSSSHHKGGFFAFPLAGIVQNCGW